MELQRLRLEEKVRRVAFEGYTAAEALKAAATWLENNEEDGYTLSDINVWEPQDSGDTYFGPWVVTLNWVTTRERKE